MGKLYDAITPRMRQFLLDQPVFFVGTAPMDGEGHVNVSPKGMSGTFVVLDEQRVAYLDYTGSGTETIAHLRENGRIVLMFCAFEGPPNIVVEVGRISDSCGFSVPLMDLRGDRDLLDRHHERRTPDHFEEYWRKRNATSIDGLPGLRFPDSPV